MYYEEDEDDYVPEFDQSFERFFKKVDKLEEELSNYAVEVLELVQRELATNDFEGACEKVVVRYSSQTSPWGRLSVEKVELLSRYMRKEISYHNPVMIVHFFSNHPELMNSNYLLLEVVKCYRELIFQSDRY